MNKTVEEIQKYFGVTTNEGDKNFTNYDLFKIWVANTQLMNLNLGPSNQKNADVNDFDFNSISKLIKVTFTTTVASNIAMYSITF